MTIYLTMRHNGVCGGAGFLAVSARGGPEPQGRTRQTAGGPTGELERAADRPVHRGAPLMNRGEAR
jgi:hypothetical protein